jgi:hypothetical protein
VVHNWPSHIFCILELGLYCLFQSLISMPRKMADPIFSAHVMGAFPRFLSWVQSQINDFKRVMEYIPCQEDEITTIDDFEEEVYCAQCKFPLVNIFVEKSSKANESKLCTTCLFKSDSENRRKKNGYVITHSFTKIPFNSYPYENNMRAKANIFGKEWKKRFTSSQHAFCYLLEGN